MFPCYNKKSINYRTKKPIKVNLQLMSRYFVLLYPRAEPAVESHRLLAQPHRISSLIYDPSAIRDWFNIFSNLFSILIVFLLIYFQTFDNLQFWASFGVFTIHESVIKMKWIAIQHSNVTKTIIRHQDGLKLKISWVNIFHNKIAEMTKLLSRPKLYFSVGRYARKKLFNDEASET